MRRRLLAAFAVVLVVGALLDATVHRDVTGAELPTVGEREAARAEATDVVFERTVPTLLGEVLDRGAIDGRFALYVALRERAPGATVLLDEASTASALPAVYLRVLAAAGDVRPFDAAGADAPVGPPSVSGTFRNGPWALHLDRGTVAEVLIFERGGTMLAVDSRLVRAVQLLGGPDDAAGVLEPAVTSARSPDNPPTLVSTIVLETLLLGALLILGGLLLPREHLSGFTGWGRASLAGVVGVALHGTLGLLLPLGLWGLVATVATTVMFGLLLQRSGVEIGWRRSDAGPLLAVLAGLGGTVALVRTSAFVTLTADSFNHWVAGAALADGALGIGDLELKRGVVQAGLHATGFALGIEGLQSVGPAVAFLAAVLVVAAAQTQRARGYASLLLLGLLLSTQGRAMMAFIGAHVLVSSLIAALVMLVGTARTRREELASLPAFAALAGALVLLRAEGPLLVALVLLGVQAVAWDRPRWPSGWATLGAITIGWAGIVSLGQGVPVANLPVALPLLGLLGVMLVGVGPVLASLPARARQMLPTLTGTLLWIVTLWLLSRDSVNFLDAVVQNVGRGAGGWGVTGPLLFVTGALAVAGTRASLDPVVNAGRLFVIGFLPLSLLAKLGDGLQDPTAELGLLLGGGGRSGWGDSVNRMWVHVVLVVVLLLVRSFGRSDDELAAGPDRRDDQRGHTGSSSAPSGSRGGRCGSGILSMSVLVAFGIVVVANWQPDYALGLVTVRDEVLRQVDGDAAMVELTDGVTVTQSIILPPQILNSARPIVGLCVDLPFITFDRRTVGEIELIVSSGELRASRVLDGRDVADWIPVRICLAPETPVLHEDSGLLENALVITLIGRDAPPGAAVGVLEGTAFGPGATFRTPTDPEGAFQQSGHLVSDVVLQVERPVGLLESPVERSVRLLPAIALLLAVGVVATGRPFRP